ncbi:TPA: hypothetical protein DIV55_02150 [Patescibacteria group bacterium]|uniref:DegT/DnrJ/EryC1/StrS aminotransferase n=1 Tax=Candidatus Gottesmanbacteria bacterium GW2011_GWA1_43_11 TaxID=1618436 RepID=A0A0G1CGV8_9BACT|nr:MAG: DegT/DnrJ/EryC1/StrS aminotransferase [Candidatus Gottesmanbacteria bacterium GW2011_GWA1_43_11]HCS78524.1 hypothetical protein [Patescibacteria group bacterium]
MFTRPIAIGLSPNTESKDYLVALQTLFQPWKWNTTDTLVALENWFKNRFSVSHAYSFNAGRSALLAILHSFGLHEGDEVLLQAFTCVAVPNSVRWAGLVPKFVDIDRTLNLDIRDAEKKISPKTKVMIVQHTFGIPAEMDLITDFCKKHGLYLVEDCAHSLGATYKGKAVGTFGTAAFFSFGRDKIISSVFGGVAITVDPIFGARMKDYRRRLPHPGFIWTLRQLAHPLAFAVILPLYSSGIGKLLLWILQKLHLLSFPVYPEEKKGRQPHDFPKQLPVALARLALAQLVRVDSFNERRCEHAESYRKRLQNVELMPVLSGAIYLRFPLISLKAEELQFRAKKEGMLFGNWYHHVIDPTGTDLTQIGYEWGSCPASEQTARTIINLPTYPTLSSQAHAQVCSFINKSYAQDIR